MLPVSITMEMWHFVRPHVALMTNYGYHTKGILLVPLEKSGELTRCFVPWSGPDSDSGIVPGWIKTVSICNLWKVKEERLPNLEKGKLFADIEKKQHDFFTCRPNLVQVGDWRLLLGERQLLPMVLVSHSMETMKLSWISGRYFKNLTKFRHSRSSDSQKWNNIIKMDCPISLSHIKLKRFPNVRDLKVDYKKFIFNSLGFSTHDSLFSFWRLQWVNKGYF